MELGNPTENLAKQQNPQVLDASLNFYPIWPEYIRERTAFTVGWSYIVCWVGLGLTLVARDHSHMTSANISTQPPVLYKTFLGDPLP